MCHIWSIDSTYHLNVDAQKVQFEQFIDTFNYTDLYVFWNVTSLKINNFMGDTSHPYVLHRFKNAPLLFKTVAFVLKSTISFGILPIIPLKGDISYRITIQNTIQHSIWNIK